MKFLLFKYSIFIAVILSIVSLYLIHKNFVIETEQYVYNQNKEIQELNSVITSIGNIQEEIVIAVDDLQIDGGAREENIASIRSGIEESAVQEISTVVDIWESRIAKIKCTHYIDDEDDETTTADSSGVVIYIGNTLHIMTNKHVLEKKDKTLKKCEIELPQSNISDIEVLPQSITKSDDRDLAYIRIDDRGVKILFDNSQFACVDEPSMGDKVITLGFPGVGAEDSVTVTDGIISGIEDDFYVTSAKIEKGNSGGAAISMKNNCFLGLPTLVVVGKIESLARILPIDSLGNMDIQNE